MQGDEARRDRPNAHIHDENAGQICPEIESEKLMCGRRQVVIVHNGERYHLRITSKQRLILTK